MYRIASFALVVACGTDQPPRYRPPSGPPRYTTTVHASPRLAGVPDPDPAPATASEGRPRLVSCVSCHSLRRPAELPTTMADLDEFHWGLKFEHGGNSCGHCHVVGDQSELRLADGSRLAMTDALTLCRQCHGLQARDYDHGAHGGKSGFWDLAVGAQMRNHCVDCHDPHQPAIPSTQPVLRPNDRGTVRSRGGH